MLTLWAHWHTYSICEDSDYSFTLLSDSWDGGRDMNYSGWSADSPPVYMQPTVLDAGPKNRTSINDVIRSQKIIGQSFSLLPLPHSQSRCSSVVKMAVNCTRSIVISNQMAVKLQRSLVNGQMSSRVRAKGQELIQGAAL